MTTNLDKNLHATVPTALLARAEAAAKQEHISLDELVTDAMQRRLSHGEFRKLLAFGKGHAKQRGLKPSDVASAIAHARSQQRGL